MIQQVSTREKTPTRMESGEEQRDLSARVRGGVTHGRRERAEAQRPATDGRLGKTVRTRRTDVYRSASERKF